MFTNALVAAVVFASAITPLSGGKGGGPDANSDRRPDSVVQRVQFRVVNTNRSQVPCAADGDTYTVSAQLVSPRERPPDPGAVTVYLHGLGFGEFFWDFHGVPGYDYADNMAAAGETSLVIDELGYGDSSRPPGDQVCIGSQADVVHQVVQDLRRGTYHVEGGRATSFRRVALVGHSAGGLIAQVEAYSFGDIDALGVLSFSDLVVSPLAMSELTTTAAACGAGAGYAPFGASPSEFTQMMFYNVAPAVLAAALARRNLDPCGETSSITTGIATDLVGVPTIRVPVLLAFGNNDALFPPPAGDAQRQLYAGDDDVDLVTLPSTGHALTLERSAPVLSSTVAAWLRAHRV